jgi:hypothetical protein
MPGALPADAQASNSEADALAADHNAMNVLQIVLQKRSGPNGVPVPINPWVGVDDLRQQGVDNALGCGRPSFSGSILQASVDVPAGASLKTKEPIVNGLPTHEETMRYALDGIAFIKPQQSLCSYQFLDGRSSADNRRKGSSLVRTKMKVNHCPTSLGWNSGNPCSVVKELSSNYL